MFPSRCVSSAQAHLWLHTASSGHNCRMMCKQQLPCCGHPQTARGQTGTVTSRQRLRPACRRAARRLGRVMTGRTSGKELAPMLSRHHMGHESVFVCMCVVKSVCISVYVQTGSRVREEMRRIKKQKGRVRMALGIPGPRGKALFIFPEKGAHLSHQWTAQGCLALF